MEKERMLIGVRKPRSETIEYAVMRNGVGERLMPILSDRYAAAPQRMFSDMIPHQRLLTARDGVEFHDAARAAGVQRWVIFQLERWRDGPVLPLNPTPLATRWWMTAVNGGNERFRVAGLRLGDVGVDGIRRNCIMGAAVELFLDDYPSALDMVECPSAEERAMLALPDDVPLLIQYYSFQNGAEPGPDTMLPDIVRRQLGLHDSVGSFDATENVRRLVLKHAVTDGEAPIDIAKNASLVALNDRTGNWPLLGDVMAEPSARVFR